MGAVTRLRSDGVIALPASRIGPQAISKGRDGQERVEHGVHPRLFGRARGATTAGVTRSISAETRSRCRIAICRAECAPAEPPVTAALSIS